MSSKKVDVEVEVTEEDLKRMRDPNYQQKERIQQLMQKIKHRIIVCSGKGGVGKTTVAVNLAVALASEGLKVGIIDIDITGPNVPIMLNLEGVRPEVDPISKRFYPVNGPLNIAVMSMAFLLETPDTPVIWRGPLKGSAIRQFMADGIWDEDIDYMIFDLPPGTSDETLDAMQLSDGDVVVVTTPQEVALLDSRKTVNMAKAMNRKVLGIIENMSGFAVTCEKCGHKQVYNLFGEGGGEKAAKELGVPFLGKIPIEVGIREGGDKGLPFIIKHPDSESAKAFSSIVRKIREMEEKQ